MCYKDGMFYEIFSICIHYVYIFMYNHRIRCVGMSRDIYTAFGYHREETLRDIIQVYMRRLMVLFKTV